MKKTIAAVAVMIGIGISGLPVLNGMIMEKRVTQIFEEISRNPFESGAGARVEIIRYERGLFSSEIEWKIISPAFEHIWGTHEIVFLDRAKHGFAGVATSTSLEKNQWASDFVNKKLKGKNPITMTTEFGLSGKMESMLALDAVSYTDGSDTVAIKPGRVILRIDGRKDSIGLNINFSGLDAAGQKILISDIGVDCEFLPDPKQASVSIKMAGRLGVFQTGGRGIKNGAVVIHIAHMDAGGYEDLKRVFQKGAADLLGGNPSVWRDTETVRRTMEKRVAEKGFEWIGICEKLLKKDLDIEVAEFKVRLPEGDIEAAGRIRLEKDVPIAELISILMAPSKALDFISLKSQAILPESLGMDGGALLSPLYPGMPTGLFVREKDRLIHMAETRGGRLFLNDKEVLMN